MNTLPDGLPDGSIEALKQSSEACQALVTAAPGAAEVFEKYSLDAVLARVQQYPKHCGYDYVDAQTVQLFDTIEQAHGAAAALNFSAALLVGLIHRHHGALTAASLTDEVKQWTVENLLRILTLIKEGNIEHMRPSQDQFRKELASANLTLLCAGAQKITKVKFPRGLIKTAPLKLIRLAVSTGPTATFYEMHTDSNDENLMKDFNEAGWTAFYRRFVDQLKLEPSVGGVLGSSWFFDPALQTVSPRLAYLWNLIMDNGGLSFCMGSSSSDIDNATVTSKTRKAKYEAGEYLPTKYKLIWPRKAMIQWAESLPETTPTAS